MKCSRFFLPNYNCWSVKLTLLLAIVSSTAVYRSIEALTADTGKRHTQIQVAQKWVPPALGCPRRIIGGGTR